MMTAMRLPSGFSRRIRPICRSAGPSGFNPSATRPFTSRSEEHTSELQSLRHLVCRLLLEKNNSVSLTDRGAVRQTVDGRRPGSRDGDADRPGGGIQFFFNNAATPEIYPLSLHEPLPI